MEKMNVGILLFNEVEVLDFAGPFEVFSISDFNTFTIAENNKTVNARNGLKLVPDYDFNNHPDIDILIIPGGYGAEEIEIKNKSLLNWIVDQHKKVNITASICTGAFLLAESGVLKNHTVTTHWMDIERLQREYPKLDVIKDTKYVDQGSVLTAAGISSGIELSLYIVSKVVGKEAANKTAKRMEYNWRIK